MTHKPVVPYSQLPSRLPVFQTVLVWLVLDRFNAVHTVVGGVALTVVALAWIGAIVGIVTEDHTPIKF